MASSQTGSEVTELHSVDVKSLQGGATYCLTVTRNTRSGELGLEVCISENGSGKTTFHTRIPFKAIAAHFSKSQTPFPCLDDEAKELPFTVAAKDWMKRRVAIVTNEGWTSQICQHS